MKGVGEFIDKLPLSMLIVFALVMLGAPYLPEPHLVEKARMFARGALTRPLDIFDVVWHLAPTVLLLARGLRLWRRQAPLRPEE